MENSQDLGTFDRRGDHLDVRFERHYPRPVERVWSALTDPARLADWMGASSVEPRLGGRIELMIDGPRPMVGRILVWEPPHILEFTWSNADAPDSIIRYELTSEAGGTRLTFAHHRMPYASSALMLPGWHNFLARLGVTLLDEPTPSPAGPSWREMQAIYIDHYKLRGVRLN